MAAEPRRLASSSEKPIHLKRCFSNRALSLFRAALRFFLQPLQLARQTCFRRRAHPIDKENSVEMINLMLNGAREKPGRFNLDWFTVQSLGSSRDRRRPLNIPGDLWKAQTTFRSG